MKASRFFVPVCLTLAAFLGLTACIEKKAEEVTAEVPASTNQEEVPPGPTDHVQFIVGTITHLGKQFVGQTPEMIANQVRGAGIYFIRDEIYWNDVEKVKGKLEVPQFADDYVNACLADGIVPLIILGYGNPIYDDGGFPLSDEARDAYVRYAKTVMEHFKGRVYLYEIWNEWDMGLGLPRGPDGKRVQGDAKEYADFVAYVYPQLKEAMPEVTILAGGHAMYSLKNGWVEDTLRYGLAKHCDGFAVHSYTRSVDDPEYWIGWMKDLERTYSEKYNDGKPIPFYVTEVGWFTHSIANVDHYRQADYIARLYLLARTMPEMKGIWYFNLADDVFGITHRGASPRPAYFSLADVIDVVSYGEYLGRINTGNPDIWILRFRMPDGSEKWAAWSRTKFGYRNRKYNSPVTGYYNVYLHTNSTNPKPLEIVLAGMGSYTQKWGKRIERYQEKFDTQVCTITLGPRPQIISGDLSQVSISNIKMTEEPDKKPTQLIDKEGQQGNPEVQ